MKRVKIMLLSLLVLAVVGGALAFKANSKFGSFICTTTARAGVFCTSTNGNPLTCLATSLTNHTAVAGNPKVCWTEIEQEGDCAENCPNLDKIEQQ